VSWVFHRFVDRDNPGLDNEHENTVDFNREREITTLDVRENEGQVEKNTRIFMWTTKWQDDKLLLPRSV